MYIIRCSIWNNAKKCLENSLQQARQVVPILRQKSYGKITLVASFEGGEAIGSRRQRARYVLLTNRLLFYIYYLNV